MFIGDSTVGKTAFVKSVQNDAGPQFAKNYIMVILVLVMTSRYNIMYYRLQVWIYLLNQYVFLTLKTLLSVNY